MEKNKKQQATEKTIEAWLNEGILSKKIDLMTPEEKSYAAEFLCEEIGAGNDKASLLYEKVSIFGDEVKKAVRWLKGVEENEKECELDFGRSLFEKVQELSRENELSDKMEQNHVCWGSGLISFGLKVYGEDAPKKMLWTIPSRWRNKMKDNPCEEEKILAARLYKEVVERAGRELPEGISKQKREEWWQAVSVEAFSCWILSKRFATGWVRDEGASTKALNEKLLGESGEMVAKTIKATKMGLGKITVWPRGSCKETWKRWMREGFPEKNENIIRSSVPQKNK